jgi:type IV secretory pathway component VirB8
VNRPEHDPEAERRARIILYTAGLSGFVMLLVVIVVLAVLR